MFILKNTNKKLLIEFQDYLIRHNIESVNQIINNTELNDFEYLMINKCILQEKYYNLNNYTLSSMSIDIYKHIQNNPKHFEKKLYDLITIMFFNYHYYLNGNVEAIKLNDLDFNLIKKDTKEVLGNYCLKSILYKDCNYYYLYGTGMNFKIF